MDVYTESEIAFDETTQLNNIYTYQIEIYDNDLKQTITVPASALTLDNGAAGYDASTPAAKDASITQLAADINADPELSLYIEAFNFNGNLVIKTLDKNYDVEFTGELKATTAVAEIQRVSVSGDVLGTTAAESLTFMGYTMTLDNSGGLFDTSNDVAAAVAANSANIVLAWNAANPTREIASVTNPGAPSSVLEITYLSTEGNVSEILTSSDNGVTFGESSETQPGRTVGILPKNPNISGREGAGAEFLQINTNINQTASKSELQLRLDTLGLTDSAFGDFEVDNTGLVTMTQDGARFAIGQVAIARFTDNRGLNPVGDNLLMETTRSGSALFNIDNDKMAEIKGGTLELSTADLSESLVNLMVFQRAFEANAKSITTADTILTTLIQLKR
jgi:flagellar hook protein FlgE